MPLGYEARNPIKLAVSEFQSAQITASVAGILLEEAVGVPHSLVPTKYASSQVWQDLSDGTVHALLEYWPRRSGDTAHLAIVHNKTVSVAGPSGYIGQFGWYFPRYLLDEIPDAVYGDFSDSSIASVFNNTLIMGDASWITHEPDLIRDHNYSLSIQTLSGEEELEDLVKTRIENKEPILFFLWSHHVLSTVFDVIRVDLLDDLEHYPPEILGKATWSEIHGYSPEAQFLFQTLSINDAQMADLIREMHNNQSEYEVACKWVRENEEIWIDWIRPSQYQEISPETRIVLWVVSGLCLLCTLFYLIVTVYFRKSKVIIASSGVFLISMCIGGMLMFGSVAAFVSNTTIGCNLFIWMLPVGFALLFGSLFAKTGRIYLLFSNKSLQLVKYTDRDVGLGVGVLLVGEIVVLGVMTGLQPAEFVFQTEGDNQFSFCLFHFPTGITLLAYNGIIMVFGIIISILVSKLRLTLYNEAKYIGWAMYNFGLVVLFVIVIFIVSDIAVRFVLVCACVLFLTLVSLSVLLIPKLHLLFTYTEQELIEMNEAQLQAVIRSYTKKFASSSDKRNSKRGDTNKTSTHMGSSFEDEMANLASSMKGLREANEELKKEVKKLKETTPDEYRSLYEKYYHENMMLKNQVYELQGLKISPSKLQPPEDDLTTSSE